MSQIAHHKAIVEGDRTKRLKTLARFFHEIDANLSDPTAFSLRIAEF